MQNSTQWWNFIKDSKELVVDWLIKQYHGEITAHERMETILASGIQISHKQRAALSAISKDEERHATWIGDLLVSRDVVPQKLDDHEDRYWNETLPSLQSVTDIDNLFAIGAHAEEMRLERIRAIVNEPSSEAVSDIKDIFVKILKDEEYHAAIFKALTTQEAYDMAANNHNNGLNVLGLIA